MTNRLLKTLGMALMGITFTACGAVDDTGVADDTRSTEGKDSLGDVQAALSALQGARVVDSHVDGIPSFVTGEELGRASPTVSGLSARADHDGAREALRGLAPVFRLNAEELVFKRQTTDEQGNRHLRYGQTLGGLEVVGDELILHIDAGGRVFAANGTARGGQRVSTQPRIAAAAAEQVARNASEATRPEASDTRLVFLRDENSGKLNLAYAVRVTGDERDGTPVHTTTFVSAVDGSLLRQANHIHSAINRAVYHGNNTSSLPGTLRRSEGGAVTNDAHIDQNYDHLGTTYNCYKTLFNRDSYNNAGAQMRSTVHHQVNYVNAFWNGSQMVYGDGDGVQAGMLGKDLDVTVHELTHAVTSSESNLTYSNESGALNEGMSDIFAAVCESWTRGFAIDADVWKIGEDIWTPATAGDALRYMANPTQDGSSKDYYPERYTGFSDNGGVHWNSGIANLAFQLLAQGGTHPRGKTTTVVPGIGVELAGRIFYKANTDLFTASTNFAAAKTGTEQAATQLGYDAATIAAVTAAWQAVGVGGGTTPPPTGTVTTLTDGVAVTSISASAGQVKYYKLTVPSGQSSVKFTTSGGTGDLDLYVKLGSQPTTTTYDCKSEGSTNAETCTINSPAAGDYFVTLSAYSTFSGASLVGDYSATTTPPTGNVLTNGVATAPYSGASGSMTCWTLSVPSGKTSVVFNQAGGTGDADLYVRFGAAPTTSTYNCRPYLSGNTETCTISNPSAGTWYACSRGYSAYSNTTMKGTY